METLAKTSMGALLLASVPVDGSSEVWLQWGLAGIVVAYTLWRDHTREQRMSEALERHEVWVRETLLKALERNAAVMERVAKLLETREEADK